jgi:hypothetical protein
MRERFNEADLGFVLYTEANGDALTRCDRVIIQLESLPKLTKDGDAPKPYDLLILDEAESILFHFHSSTMAGKRKPIFDLLCHLIVSAGAVFALDADLSSRTKYLIVFLRKGPRVAFENRIVADHNDYIVVRSHTKWVENLLNALRNGQRIVVVLNSNIEARAVKIMIDKKFPDKSNTVKLITGDSADSVKQSVARCNEEWVQLDALIYTPTIGPGVDFSKTHFDVMFCYAVSNSGPARAHRQQMRRVRHLRAQRVELYIEQSSSKGLPVEADEIASWLKSVKNTRDKASKALVTEIAGYFRQERSIDRYYARLDRTLFVEFWISIIQEVHDSMNRFKGILLQLIRDATGRPTHEDTRAAVEEQQIKALVHQARELAEQQRAKDLALNGAPPSDTVKKARQSVKAARATATQKVVVAVANFCEVYGVMHTNDEKFTKRWCTGRAAVQFKNYLKLTEPLAKQIATEIDLVADGAEFESSLDSISYRLMIVHVLLTACGFGDTCTSLGNIDATAIVSSETIEERLASKYGKILRGQIKTIKTEFKLGFDTESEWTPRRAANLLESVLQEFCGLPLKRHPNTQKRQPNGERKNIFYISLDSQDWHDMQELRSYKLGTQPPVECRWKHLLSEERGQKRKPDDS